MAKVKISRKSNAWRNILFIVIAAVIIILVLNSTFDLPSVWKSVKERSWIDKFSAEPEYADNVPVETQPEMMVEVMTADGERKLVKLSDIDPSKNEDIVIGVMVPVTGEFASVGVAVSRGIHMAFTEANKAGGVLNRTVVGVYRDTACDYNKAKTVFGELVAVKNVPAVIGGVCAQSTFITSDFANLTNTVVLTPATGNPKIKYMTPYVFGTYPYDDYGAEVMARYMAAAGFNRTAVFYVGDANYGNYLYDRFQDVYEKELGRDIVIREAFDPGETFFKDAIFRVLKRDPDSVFIIHHGEGAALVRDLNSLGVNKNIFGTDAFNNPDVVRMLGKDIEKVTFTRPAYDPSEFEVKEFRNKVMEFYNLSSVPPHEYYIANAYDTTKLLLEAIEANGYDGPAIREYLMGVSDWDGVTGGLTIDEFREPIRDYQVIRYEHGRPTVLQEY